MVLGLFVVVGYVFVLINCYVSNGKIKAN